LIGIEARPRETAAASDTDRPCGPRIRIAVPADDELTEPSITLLRDAGYTQRINDEDLLVVDPVNAAREDYGTTTAATRPGRLALSPRRNRRQRSPWQARSPCHSRGAAALSFYRRSTAGRAQRM